MFLKLVKASLTSRTVQFNLLIMLAGALQGFVFTLPISPIWQSVIFISLGAAGIILRAVTVNPLFDKE